MKLTKQERAAMVLLVCLGGIGAVVVTLAGLWLWVNMPVDFWLAVCSGCVGALSFFAMRWKREWRACRRTRRQELYLCPYCEKLLTLNDYLAHRCQERRRP